MHQPTEKKKESWSDAFRHTAQRLTLSACDGNAASVLTAIQNDALVHAPYYAKPQQDGGEEWQQQQGDWQTAARFNLAVCERSSRQVIGCVRFTPVSVSYFLHPAYWGRGLGSEMVLAACSYMPQLLDLPILRATVLRENVASRRILEQAGFAFAGMGTQVHRGVATVAVLNYQRPGC